MVGLTFKKVYNRAVFSKAVCRFSQFASYNVQNLNCSFLFIIFYSQFSIIDLVSWPLKLIKRMSIFYLLVVKVLIFTLTTDIYIYFEQKNEYLLVVFLFLKQVSSDKQSIALYLFFCVIWLVNRNKQFVSFTIGKVQLTMKNQQITIENQ